MNDIDPWVKSMMEKIARADRLATEAYENMLKPGITDFQRDEYRRQRDHYVAERQRLQNEFLPRNL